MICADFVFLGPCCVGLYHLCRLVDAPVLLCTPLEPSTLLREANRRRASLSARNMVEMVETKACLTIVFYIIKVFKLFCQVFHFFKYQVLLVFPMVQLVEILKFLACQLRI